MRCLWPPGQLIWWTPGHAGVQRVHSGSPDTGPIEETCVQDSWDTGNSNRCGKNKILEDTGDREVLNKASIFNKIKSH